MTEPDTQNTPSDEAEAKAGVCTAEVTSAEDAAADEQDFGGDPDAARGGRQSKSRGRVLVFVVVPVLLMGMAVGAGYVKYQDGSVKDAQSAAISSVRAATDGTIALLSYTPDTAQATLTAASDRLTGAFRDTYTTLTNDVVIPAAKQKKISSTATVPAASSVSATQNHAVVLVFVDQSIIVGNGAPSSTASAVQVTLDNTGDRWLISGFDPK